MVPFLKKLSGFFSAWLSGAALLPRRIGDAEQLTRYLFSDKLFAASVGRVKHHAFTPKNGETSVFRVAGLPNWWIWSLGRKSAGAVRGQPPRARADLATAIVRQAGLDVLPATRVHKRHANIVGWHRDKEKERLAAMELARFSTLLLP